MDAAAWCKTCGNPVENGQCACWCHVADALQRFLGMDFDHSADLAARMWAELGGEDRARVWSAEYANDHDVPVYPDTRAYVPASYAPAGVRAQDARDFPHDEDCPVCGRRQWALGPDTADPANPTDAEQLTCGACGTSFAPRQA